MRRNILQYTATHLQPCLTLPKWKTQIGVAWCGVFQCVAAVAVCCSWCSVLKSVAVTKTDDTDCLTSRGTMCCSVLQCVAVGCSVLHPVAVTKTDDTDCLTSRGTNARRKHVV